MQHLPSAERKYSSYRSYIVGRSVEAIKLFDNLRNLKDAYLVTEPRHFRRKLIDLQPRVLDAVSFFLEHRDKDEFPSNYWADLLKAERDARFVELGGSNELLIASDDPLASLELALAIAEMYEHLSRETLQSISGHAMASNKPVPIHELSYLKKLYEDIQGYIDSPRDQLHFLAEYMNPYQLSMTPNERETRLKLPPAIVSSRLDIDNLIAFGNVFGRMVAEGHSIAEIQDALAYSTDTVLRTCLVPLSRDCPEAIDRINHRYFGRESAGYRSLESAISDWNLTQLSSEPALNGRPHAADKLDVPMTATQLANLASYGLSISRSMN